MKSEKRCVLVLALLMGNVVASANGPSARSDTRTFVLESTGGLGGGVGLAAIGLPFTLAAYLFSGGDISQTAAAEGVLLGLGSAVGACWTGRKLGRPARIWPALGLAFVPEVVAGLVMGLTHKGADLSDPLIMGCCAGAILASPVLATVGANIGRGAAPHETGSRVQVTPKLCVCTGSPHPAAGLGFRLSF